jgi:hypothetical protein
MGTRRSVNRRDGDIVGNYFFLESSGIRPNLSMTREGLLCVDRVRYIWSGTIHGLSVGCACESASRLLVDFGVLNDKLIKGLISCVK